MEVQSILEVKGVNKSFGSNAVLKKVNFTLKPGEVMGLVGENGAGKSTLMKIITGVYSFDGGSILYKGHPIHFANAKEALGNGIAIIHQEFNLFQNLSAAENIFLDRHDFRNRFGWVNWSKIREEAEKVLAQLGETFDVNTLVSEIDVREQQLVEIAKAVSSDAKVIIMDEPSASLPENEVNQLFKVIRTLKEQGVSIIYVSHRMNEIMQICDRVTVLRNGADVGVLDMKDPTITLEGIVTLMVGRKIEDYYPHTPHKTGKTVLEVNHISNELLHDLSFSIKEREIVGIYGLAGSGSTELAECIFGLSKLHRGEIKVGDNILQSTSPKKAIAKHISYVPSDRKREGIISELSIEQNIILANLKKYTQSSFLKQRTVKESAQKYINDLKIKTISAKQKLADLSGGNQQKVVLARWLDTAPTVLLLNEPTRGVDVGAKAEIYALIDQLLSDNIGILIISSELEEVLGMCDRIIVMNKGMFTKELVNDGSVTQEIILRYASQQKEAVS